MVLATLVLIAGSVGSITQAGATEPPPTAKQAKSLRLTKKVIKSKNPKKTYKALSKKDRGILDKEVKKGKSRGAILRVRRFSLPMPQGSGPTGAPARTPAASQKNCIEVEAWVVHGGGYSGWVMTKVTQVSEFCKYGGKIHSVVITDTWTEVNYLGFRAGDTMKQTKNTGTSGRSVVRQQWIYGAGGWDLFRFTECVQIRVNASLDPTISMNCSLS